MVAKTYYGAIFGTEGDYGIVFPDFPGSPSQGSTLEHVAEMGREALQGHVEVMADYGDAIPEPSVVTLESVAKAFDDAGDPDDEPWVAVVPITVEMPVLADTSTVAVRSELVREIAAMVQSNVSHLSARQFIETATRRELDRLKASA